MDSKRPFAIAECQQAAKGLKSSWQDMAGSEALIRASLPNATATRRWRCSGPRFTGRSARKPTPSDNRLSRKAQAFLLG